MSRVNQYDDLNSEDEESNPDSWDMEDNDKSSKNQDKERDYVRVDTALVCGMLTFVTLLNGTKRRGVCQNADCKIISHANGKSEGKSPAPSGFYERAKGADGFPAALATAKYKTFEQMEVHLAEEDASSDEGSFKSVTNRRSSRGKSPKKSDQTTPKRGLQERLSESTTVQKPKKGTPTTEDPTYFYGLRNTNDKRIMVSSIKEAKAQEKWTYTIIMKSIERKAILNWVNSADSDEDSEYEDGNSKKKDRKERKKNKERKKKDKGKEKRKSRRLIRDDDDPSDDSDSSLSSSSSSSFSDSSASSLSDYSTRSQRQKRRTMRKNRRRREKKRSSKRTYSKVNMHRRDPSTSDKTKVYGIGIKSTEMTAFLAPEGMLKRDESELMDLTTDVLSLPGASNMCMNLPDDGNSLDMVPHMMDAMAAASGRNKERVIPRDTTFRSTARHGLKSIKDLESLVNFSFALDEAQETVIDAYHGVLTAFLTLRRYDNDEIEEYLTFGVLPIIVNKTFVLCQDLIARLCVETRKGGWERSLGSAMLSYHSKKLWALRSHAVNKKDLLLNNYVYLRDAKEKGFLNDTINSSIWAFVSSTVPPKRSPIGAGPPREVTPERDDGRCDIKSPPKCSHCNSNRIHPLMCPPIGEGRGHCPFKDLPQTKARAARKAALEAFDADRSISKMRLLYLEPFIAAVQA